MHAIIEPLSQSGSFDVAGPQIYSLGEFIQLIDQFSGMRHRIIPLGPTLSRIMAGVAQFAPGQPLTPDNLLSLQAPGTVRDDTPAPYGIQPTRFEAVAESWLSHQYNRMDRYRMQAGR